MTITLIKYTLRFDDETPESAIHMRVIAFSNLISNESMEGDIPRPPGTGIMVQRRIAAEYGSGFIWESRGDRVPSAVLGRMAIDAFLAYTMPGTNRYEGRSESSVQAILAAEGAARNRVSPSWSSPGKNSPPWIPDLPEVLTVDLGEFVEPRTSTNEHQGDRVVP